MEIMKEQDADVIKKMEEAYKYVFVNPIDIKN